MKHWGLTQVLPLHVIIHAISKVVLYTGFIVFIWLIIFTKSKCCFKTLFAFSWLKEVITESFFSFLVKPKYVKFENVGTSL